MLFYYAKRRVFGLSRRYTLEVYMIYAIMCGGDYSKWDEPRQLKTINGEPLVSRTIRLLKENGVENICITATDERFDNFGVPRLKHSNNYKQSKNGESGYWLDAFYPFREPITYLFGDVYFTEQAIKDIISCEGGNILYGSKIATNKLHQNWGEPFAYVVNDWQTFKKGIEAVKRLQDEGKTKRVPIAWELYRYLNGIDVNTHEVREETFRVIDDETIDIDSPKAYEELKVRIEHG